MKWFAKYHAEGIVTDADEYRNDILKRESESTTGIGEGIAMPHAKDSAVTRATVLFAKALKALTLMHWTASPCTCSS